MSPKDDGISETDRIETVYTVGPGLRMAIIFVCFLVTLGIGFAGGWFGCKNSIMGTDKSNQVEVLKSDTKEGLRLVEDFLVKKDAVETSRKGREYDEECANKPIRDLIK